MRNEETKARDMGRFWAVFESLRKGRAIFLLIGLQYTQICGCCKAARAATPARKGLRALPTEIDFGPLMQ